MYVMMKLGFEIPGESRHYWQKPTPGAILALRSQTAHSERLQIQLDVSVKRVKSEQPQKGTPAEIASAKYLAQDVFAKDTINGLAVFHHRPSGEIDAISVCQANSWSAGGNES